MTAFKPMTMDGSTGLLEFSNTPGSPDQPKDTTPVQTASREVTIPTSDHNLFARLDRRLSPAHPLTSRDNYVKASDENLTRVTTRGIAGRRTGTSSTTGR
jgi:hypothetical protein